MFFVCHKINFPGVSQGQPTWKQMISALAGDVLSILQFRFDDP